MKSEDRKIGEHQFKNLAEAVGFPGTEEEMMQHLMNLKALYIKQRGKMPLKEQRVVPS